MSTEEQQRQALSAFSLLVDAANAQSRNSVGSGADGGAAGVAGGNSHASAAMAADGRGSATREAAVAAHAVHQQQLHHHQQQVQLQLHQQRQHQQQFQQRQQKQHQQLQQQQHQQQQEMEAMEIQEALQRELIHREAMRRQAALMSFSGIGGGGGGGGLGPPFNHGNNTSNGLVAAQEAEYLQQLRLEALVQQRRQETLAQLALAQELGMPQEMAAMLEAEQLRQATLMRQEMLLNGAGGMHGGFGGANGGAEGLFGVLGAPSAGTNGDESILQLLQERERQRKFAALVQAHQAQQQAQAAGSATAYHHPGHDMERADLIGSVFTKNAAAIAAIEEEQQQKQNELDLHQRLLQQRQQAELEQQELLLKERLSLQKQPPSLTARSQMETQPPVQELQQDPNDHLLTDKHDTDDSKAAILPCRARGLPMHTDDSKATILPCRARGMPMNHNVKTAYFVIPEDIKHGTELVCSYFVCRNAGIKFRYCVYCKLPVAKRNFAKRHRHWGKIAPSDLPKDILDGTPGDDDLSTSEQGTIEIIKGEKQGEEGDDERDASVASSTRGSAPPANSHQWSSDELLGELMARNAEELQQEQTTPLEPLSDDTLARFVKERQVAWQDLLLRRPKSPSSSAMLGWVQEILRVSDVGGGAPPANSVIPTASGSFVGKDPVKDVVDTKSNVSNESECLNGTEHQPDALRSSETCNAGSKKSNGHSVMVATQNADKQEKGKEDVGEPAVVTGTQVNDRKVENDHEYDDDDDFDNEDDEYGDGEDEEGEIPDDASTSSEDSVDLRISKKAKTS